MKKIKLLSLTAACVLLAAAAHAADFNLNVSSSLTVDDPMFKGLQQFKDGVEKNSGGKISVRLFPSSQLGSDEDVLEQARSGAGVAVLVDGGRLAPFVKEFGVLGAPYLTHGYTEMRKVVTSPLMDDWNNKLRAASGHQILSFNWYQGDRQLLTMKPVKTPADLAGVRMRTPGAPVWLETVRGLGATPTPMPWAEVYSALQMKAIDAAEAQAPATYGQRLFEVVKYITKTGHISLITGLVGSKIWFDKLPANLQKVVHDEALKAGDTASKATIDSIGNYEKLMREKGVQIVDIDTKPFVASTSVVYEKLGYTDLRKQVNAVLAK
ncbi:C4-dicarboxylate TRAP transporter substrate-binding protein [Rhodoferax fermentans]|uniref:C4-dicarboxylate ABC transporter n=1 Tax=Rhodoferax fermentans TaxID=28066 RepID=A0A1T1ATX9_RHOFE|nr:C4-dicarboxylate TRAP transporter substrate-binding protein [Rhodoferax fermentans]MBK1685311.1 C4-dicarboxylate ABC transporter [Rhodoferax fermentans]OOV07564.1 C4-dicarboxylate ABC transporter [Rhodoferax fermentans]